MIRLLNHTFAVLQTLTTQCYRRMRTLLLDAGVHRKQAELLGAWRCDIDAIGTCAVRRHC